MKKTNYKYIYNRTRQMLMKPELVWNQALDENFDIKDLFRNYLFPVAVVISVFTFLFHLIHYGVLQSIGLAIINLISTLSGAWFAFLVTREYLCSKLNYQDNHALNLTVYSSAIFIIFHSIGAALGDSFIGQLFTLLSFIFIRTLYIGIKQLPDLQVNQRTNILVIASLSIICIPIIISQILMIVFRISAINV